VVLGRCRDVGVPNKVIRNIADNRSQPPLVFASTPTVLSPEATTAVAASALPEHLLLCSAP
jgi:hypothetical protein